MSKGEKFQPRGIGSNWLPCCVCGKGGEGAGYTLLPDMASFVEDHAAGLRVEAMFVAAGLNGFLDYRPSEPKWVQFKLGACEEHLPLLERLAKLVFANGKVITAAIIEEAVAGLKVTP